MKRTIITLAITLAFISGLHGQDDPARFTKPADYGYYNMMVGYEKSDAISTHDGAAVAVWGQARMSIIDVGIGKAPRKKFQFRDIIDVQFGFGAGQEFYANFAVGVGAKMKFDVSKNVDFGFNFIVRGALDRISYWTYLPQGFLHIHNLFLEFGGGNNNYDDDAPSDKDRKVMTFTAKYYLKKDDPRSWSINFSYWKISGRYMNLTNIWENDNQIMIGVGKSLTNY